MSTVTRPTVVCAWCLRTLTQGSEDVSHGICLDCLRTYMPEVYADLRRSA